LGTPKGETRTIVGVGAGVCGGGVVAGVVVAAAAAVVAGAVAGAGVGVCACSEIASISSNTPAVIAAKFERELSLV
jgi:hypothetical protein